MIPRVRRVPKLLVPEKSLLRRHVISATFVESLLHLLAIDAHLIELDLIFGEQVRQLGVAPIGLLGRHCLARLVLGVQGIDCDQRLCVAELARFEDWTARKVHQDAVELRISNMKLLADGQLVQVLLDLEHALLVQLVAHRVFFQLGSRV